MAHHSNIKDDEIKEAREKLHKLWGERLGPTGNFPLGKLTKDDEGELAFAVFIKNKKVIIDFNSPVHWFGMTKDQAKELGELLVQKSESI